MLGSPFNFRRSRSADAKGEVGIELWRTLWSKTGRIVEVNGGERPAGETERERGDEYGDIMGDAAEEDGEDGEDGDDSAAAEKGSREGSKFGVEGDVSTSLSKEWKKLPTGCS